MLDRHDALVSEVLLRQASQVREVKERYAFHSLDIPGAAIHLSAGCHRVAQSDDLAWLLGLGTLPRLCQMLSSVEHLLAGYGGVRAGLQLDPGLRVKFRCFGTDAVEDQPRAFLDRASNGDDELEAETRLVACRS